MKHTENLMVATIKTKRNAFIAIVDKYAGNRYKVVVCKDCPSLVGHEYKYGHGLTDRKHAENVYEMYNAVTSKEEK